MRAWLARLFPVDQYTDSTERNRAVLIYSLCVLVALAYTIYFAFEDDSGQVPSLWNIGRDPFTLVTLITMYIGALAGIYFTRTRQLAIAAYMPPVAWLASGFALAFREGFQEPGSALTPVMLFMVGGLLAGIPGWRFWSITAIGLLVLRFALGRAGIMQTGLISGLFVPLFAETLVASFVIALYLRTARIVRSAGYSQAAEQRLNLANVTAQIAQRVSSRRELSDVLDTTVAQILANYPGIYHAQIFLNDAANLDAQLVASTGEVGQMLLARQHRLPVNSQSVVGRVTGSGQPVIARAGAPDGIHRPNPLLPDTLVEAGFPLRLGGVTIGAVDLQSRSLDAFPDEELPIFESLASNIAVAIDNARLFEETRTRLLDNQRLTDQTRRAAAETERLNAQLTRQTWAGYAGDRQAMLNLDLDLTAGTQHPVEAWSETMQAARQSRGVVQTAHDDMITVSAPMMVRGQVVGVLEFDVPGEDALDDESLLLVQAVADRLSVAAENSRLYEDSQAAIAQEQRVNAISASYQKVTSIDELLDITVRQLGDALGAKRGAIRLGRSDDAPETARSAAALPDRVVQGAGG